MKCLNGRDMEEVTRKNWNTPPCGGPHCRTCGHNPKVRQERQKMQRRLLANGLEGIVLQVKTGKETAE